jgi:hypothetical protein
MGATGKFQPGDRVGIKAPHPWYGKAGEVIQWEYYGPVEFGWQGWRIKLDGYDGEIYAKPEQMVRL